LSDLKLDENLTIAQPAEGILWNCAICRFTKRQRTAEPGETLRTMEIRATVCHLLQNEPIRRKQLRPALREALFSVNRVFAELDRLVDAFERVT
jgi:hypothetical protein